MKCLEFKFEESEGKQQSAHEALQEDLTSKQQIDILVRPKVLFP